MVKKELVYKFDSLESACSLLIICIDLNFEVFDKVDAQFFSKAVNLELRDWTSKSPHQSSRSNFFISCKTSQDHNNFFKAI